MEQPALVGEEGTSADSGCAFTRRSEESPCTGCSAPCCRVLLIPRSPPTTFMDADYWRFTLGFRGTSLLVGADGRWQLVLETVCRLLDEASNRCTAHATSGQPKTCVYYNPYQCWYRRNLTAEPAADSVRLYLADLDSLLANTTFDANGIVVDMPGWAQLREMVFSRRSRSESPVSRD